jgi:hypothetical protein
MAAIVGFTVAATSFDILSFAQAPYLLLFILALTVVSRETLGQPTATPDSDRRDRRPGRPIGTERTPVNGIPVPTRGTSTESGSRLPAATIAAGDLTQPGPPVGARLADLVRLAPARLRAVIRTLDPLGDVRKTAAPTGEGLREPDSPVEVPKTPAPATDRRAMRMPRLLRLRRTGTRVNRDQVGSATATVLAICGGLASLYMVVGLVAGISFSRTGDATTIAAGFGLLWLVGFRHRATKHPVNSQRRDRERRGF